MAPGTGLTPRQEQLLAVAVTNPYITDNFYLSGGTALASWYLQHRESYDLDFFATAVFDYELLKKWFWECQEKIGFRHVSFNEDYGFLTVSLRFPNDTFLKIDFSHYTKTQIWPGFKWRGLAIDSLYDITVNKIDTVATLPRTRDYVDLYFINKKQSLDLDKLIYDACQKFSDDIDPLKLAKNFLKVIEYTDYPKMLVPFNPKEMEKFYINLAKSLKNKIFS